jgi:hypothetical protein
MESPSTVLRTGFDLAQDRLRGIQDVFWPGSPDYIRATWGMSIQQSYGGEPLAPFVPSLASRPIVR